MTFYHLCKIDSLLLLYFACLFFFSRMKREARFSSTRRDRVDRPAKSQKFDMMSSSRLISSALHSTSRRCRDFRNIIPCGWLHDAWSTKLSGVTFNPFPTYAREFTSLPSAITFFPRVRCPDAIMQYEVKIHVYGKCQWKIGIIRVRETASVQKVLHARTSDMNLSMTMAMFPLACYRHSTGRVSHCCAKIFPVWHFWTRMSPRFFQQWNLYVIIVTRGLLLGLSTKLEAVSRLSLHYRKQFALLYCES